MADSDFREKMRLKREEVELKYRENSDDAWEQVKEFIRDPNHLLIAGIFVLLLIALFFTLKFVFAVRAPDLVRMDDPFTLGETVVTAEPGEEGVIDDSNTEQPMLSGARKENYYTFLLFGTDKFSGSTDTIMVVSYDVKNQKLNLMSIPRDTMVNVSWDIKKINSVYAMGGIKTLQKHIGKLIGFTPDYYVKIDLQAFVDVVDLLGGVEFDVPISMHYHDPAQGLSIDLEPGMQTLNGEQAMGLVRFRKSDRGANGRISGYDDTGRVATQQAFLKAMFQKCVKLTNWTKITNYVEIFEKNVESDLTLGNMLWFARQAMDLGEDGFTTCTAPGDYYAQAWSRSTGNMQSYVTLYANQMIQLVNTSFNPYLARVSMMNLDIMSINADGSIMSSTGYVADSRATPRPVADTTPEDTDETAQPTEGEPTGNEPTEGETAPGLVTPTTPDTVAPATPTTIPLTPTEPVPPVTTTESENPFMPETPETVETPTQPEPAIEPQPEPEPEEPTTDATPAESVGAEE